MVILMILGLAFAQFEGWDVFAQVQYELKYIEEYGEVDIPVFPESLKAYEGKDFIIKGYHLPIDYDRKTIVLSQLPYSSCFFCGGGGGLETIAEINFSEKQRRFAPDEILRIKGKLKLNNTDFERFVFILEEAELIE